MKLLRKSLLALFRTMGEALLTVLCIAMGVVALCSVFEGWLL